MIEHFCFLTEVVPDELIFQVQFDCQIETITISRQFNIHVPEKKSDSS